MRIKGTSDKFPFSIPMIWREPRDYSSDCYFCVVKTSVYKKKNKCKIEYPSLPSVMRPVPHTAEIPVPVFKELPSLKMQGNESDEHRSDPCDEDFEADDSVRKGFNQLELNDLAQDLELPKKKEKSSELQHRDCMRKTSLKKELRYPTFDQEKVRFCNTFEVMMDLCNAIMYMFKRKIRNFSL